MSTWISTAIIVGLSLWLANQVSAQVRRIQGVKKRREWVLDTQNPVFSRAQIQKAFENAVAESGKLREKYARFREDPDFKSSREQKKLSPAVEARMLDVCEGVVEAEKRWFWHGAMIDANLAATTGKSSREDALAAAQMKFDAMTSIKTFDDARLAKDEWKGRIESGSDPASKPRAYQNPWADRALNDPIVPDELD